MLKDDDDDDDDIEIPSNSTKQGIYELCWFDRGWLSQAKGGRGCYGKVANFKKLSNYPVSMTICVLSSFFIFWYKEVKYIKINKSSHDTWSSFYLFEMRLSGIRRRKKQAALKAISDEWVALGVPVAHINDTEMIILWKKLDCIIRSTIVFIVVL